MLLSTYILGLKQILYKEFRPLL